MERMTCHSTVFAVAVVLTWWTTNAAASCSGTSPTWTAASAERDDVNDCVAAASPGDMIYVPAGTGTWSSTITVGKSVSIIGAGIGQTNVTAAGECFRLNLAHTIRISGFSFTDCTIRGSMGVAEGATFRIDHNSFRSASRKTNQIDGYCQTPQLHPTGLIDNNELHNYRTVVFGTICMLAEGDNQHQLWAQEPPVGGGTGIVYVEDNTITSDVPGVSNWIDGNYGARYVARFNSITNSGSAATYVEVHSVQGLGRAVQWWEFYGNTQSGNTGFFGFAFLRGGSGFLWGNRVPSGTASFKLNNVRSNTGCATQGTCHMGPCDGTADWDQNTPDLDGHACRDQIGRSYDIFQWSPGDAYNQPSTPAYFWDNIAGESTQYSPVLHDGGTGTSYVAAHLRRNRDWYTQDTSFDGKTAVGVGLIAKRPSTCTPGVAYWATDRGDWNSRNSGPDGQLYRCTAPDTWTLHYTPYTYPHPLQGAGSGGSRPAPPTNLSVVVQ